MKTKNHTQFLLNLKSELEKIATQEPILKTDRFSKEPFRSYGIKILAVRKISAEYWQKIKDLDKQEIFELCEELLQTKISENMTIAFDWTFRLKSKYTPEDYKIFFNWLEKYCDTWFYVDDFSAHAFGHFISMFPEFSKKILEWARSKNRWLKRASAVVLIYPLRKKLFFDLAIKVANILLQDEDDLVQKGYGWMLKEASKQYPDEVYKYVFKNKDKMPRTALRYAIEKYPQEIKKKLMSKN